ncbi:hypothetical protein, partial [Serratia marcescens]|uniref:hypothetical protein n=1 Tax=Serratia marcescens TaxID=615 RepID=UPI0019D6EDC4
ESKRIDDRRAVYTKTIAFTATAPGLLLTYCFYNKQKYLPCLGDCALISDGERRPIYSKVFASRAVKAGLSSKGNTNEQDHWSR